MKNTNKDLFIIKDGKIVSKLNLDQILPYSLKFNLYNEDIEGNKFSTDKNDDIDLSNDNDCLSNKTYSLIQDLFSKLINSGFNQSNENTDDEISEHNLDNDIKLENILFKINSNDLNSKQETDIYTANDLLNNISFIEVFADQIIEQLNNRLDEIEVENSKLFLSYKNFKSGIRFDDIIKKLSPEEETLLDVVRYFKQQELLDDTSLFSILNKLIDNKEYKEYLSSLDNQRYLYENISIEDLEILLKSIINNSNELLSKLYDVKKLY